MDSCLTKSIPFTLPVWRKYGSLPKLDGYTQISSLTPILQEFLSIGGTTAPTSEGQLQADHLFGRVHEWEGSGPCVVEMVNKKKKKTYCKVTHLLDPIRTLRGYYIHPVKGERRRQDKLNNSMNQAFVDSLANYLLGQVRERGLSPHFCLYYGGFQGIADTYRFNISDDFESFRKYKDFWERRRTGIFSLHLDLDNIDTESESESGSGSNMKEHAMTKEEIEDEFAWVITTPKSSLHSHFSYNTPSTRSSSQASHETLEDLCAEQNGLDVELQSVHSFVSKDESIPELEEIHTNKKSDEDDYNDTDEDSESPSIDVYAEFKNYPVMLIFQEQMEGVLDDLLEDEEEDEDNNKKDDTWEKRWTAWLFQIIAALCAAQGILGFTHNDLHTNNIVWTDTDEPWLFYKNRAGEVWRIPTFGKLFRIIDFGRSCFRVGDKWFISDDYDKGNDAGDMYNWNGMTNFDTNDPIVYPNPSFDLCRLSVSLLEALFPETPAEKLDGLVMSKEDDWEMHETESPLFNLLWSWLIDEKGKNVLREEDGEERYPAFDLYIHVAKHVFSAKPQDQIHRSQFADFRLDASKVGDWEKVYPLFC